ncbi:Uncharacterized protein TPAR_03444 [Tolypocladium paradoxum]|uniref:ADP-ribosylation factor n=1 Tax=Tolypocladium paradoxum TaxID=94208 RepID=A0A2S4L1U2_9HYPO|nr:Uncharacterized protein TPAR_03444 [Tolypocladium paradoxum]
MFLYSMSISPFVLSQAPSQQMTMKLGQWIPGRSEEHSGMICGLDACGKTTLLYRWKTGETVTTIATIGFNVETIPHGKRWKLTLWDVGGGDRVRPLMRHYLAEDRLIIFVHDCVDQERLDEQLAEFHSCAKKMFEVGGRYMWILFNKQDGLPPDKRDSTVQDLMSRYETAAARYSDSVVVRILDLPGLSAKEGTQIHAVLDDIKQTLQEFQKPTARSQVGLGALPNADARSRWKLAELAEEMVNADGTTPDEFWRLFESGQLPVWGLYNHLKAGYFIMIDGFTAGSSILESAEVFITHLQRLRGINADRFPITTHMTMTVFWLVQLQIAALHYRDGRTGKPLSRDDFKNVLLRSPELMDAGLWKDYYSTDRLFTPGARERWCAPDVKPFPSVIRSPNSYTPSHTRPAHSESDRLIGFALAVVQKSLRSKLTRGALVKKALGELQSSIIRQRASQPSLPPYSETKAYFWIQLAHAALASLEAKQPPEQKSMTGWKGSVQALTPAAFKALFGITGEEWREYYSQRLWDSVGARMVFKNPDWKMLPAIFPVPALANVQSARSKLAYDFGLVDSGHWELPSPEDLDLMAAVVVDEAELVDMEGPEGPIIRKDSHATRLLRPYREARDATEYVTKEALGMSAALDAEVSGSDVDGLTKRAFWVQQLVAAMEETPWASTFEELICANPHLAYHHMERRTYATFKKQWPGPDTAFTVTSPRFGSFDEYPDADNPRDLVISIMVGGLVRIRDYPARGFQVEQEIPREVGQN